MPSASPGGPCSLHPLDPTDRPIIEALAQVDEPSDMDAVNAARLLTRYRDSLLSADLYQLLLRALDRWGLTPRDIRDRARDLWLSGWRPPAFIEEQQVGSGADVNG
jgi:hypothetical protein